MNTELLTAFANEIGVLSANRIILQAELNQLKVLYDDATAQITVLNGRIIDLEIKNANHASKRKTTP